jgi:hypothetical protein
MRSIRSKAQTYLDKLILDKYSFRIACCTSLGKINILRKYETPHIIILLSDKEQPILPVLNYIYSYRAEAVNRPFYVYIYKKDGVGDINVCGHRQNAKIHVKLSYIQSHDIYQRQQNELKVNFTYLHFTAGVFFAETRVFDSDLSLTRCITLKDYLHFKKTQSPIYVGFHKFGKCVEVNMILKNILSIVDEINFIYLSRIQKQIHHSKGHVSNIPSNILTFCLENKLIKFDLDRYYMTDRGNFVMYMYKHHGFIGSSTSSTTS